MFVKNKVIDKNKVQSVIESRNLITYDSIKEEWNDVLEMSKEFGTEIENGEFNFYELYDVVFGSILCDLTLDELEYIRANNLFGFVENDILDYRCKKNIDRRINNYRRTISDIINYMQKENIGSYFGRFGDLFHMNANGLHIARILGLNRNGIELTPEGEKLKICIDNIRQLHNDNFKQRHTTSKHNPVKR